MKATNEFVIVTSCK